LGVLDSLLQEATEINETAVHIKPDIHGLFVLTTTDTSTLLNQV
jgi:hypothetical protein